MEKELLAVIYGLENVPHLHAWETNNYGIGPLHQAPKRFQCMLLTSTPSTLAIAKSQKVKSRERVKFIKSGWPETKGELSHLVLPST